MPANLTHHSYGKSAIRLTKVIRRDDRHDLIEYAVTVTLAGDFGGSYTTGDNSKIVATDSMKNTVYVLAAENNFDSPEAFASLAARHFVKTYEQVESAEVRVEQGGWSRINVDGEPHASAFHASGRDVRIGRAVAGASGVQVGGGIGGLVVLRTSGSEFWGFVADRYRTLGDSRDRIFATTVDAEWTFAESGDFNADYDAMRGAMLTTFATHHSLAVQQTLNEMGKAALDAVPAVRKIELSMPNQHRIPFNLEPFGLENTNAIFVPTAEPFGMITGVVEREAAQ